MLRSLRLKFGVVAGLVFAAAPLGAGEWQTLFNGRNLDGWEAIDGPLASWKVDDGLLYCSGGGGGWLSTKNTYKNFEVEVEFRVPAGGNSGVFLRAPHEGNPAFAGMEVQILDDADAQYASLQPYQYCGSLYGIAAPKTRVSKPAGEWQKLAITCVGRRVTAKLNGTPIVDADLDAHPDKEKEHPGIKRNEGYVGLQNHGTRLDFRSVRLRELP
ncbi:MAG: DUF1080 domain-containing protein [Pirellulales bacterium]